MCIIYSNKKIRKRFLKESRLAKDTLYTVRFLIGHDILARVLFLCRRDFEGKEQGCSRRRGRDRETEFRTWDERATDDSGRCLSGGIGQGAAEEGFPRASRVPPPLPIPPRRSNRDLDSLKFASTIAFVPRAARHLGRFHRPRRYIFLGNRTHSNGIAAFHLSRRTLSRIRPLFLSNS